MTKYIEREAFLEYWRENNLPYEGDDADKEKCFEYWQAAKAHEAEKLKGCVMVPVRTDNEIIDQTIKLMDLLATSTNRFQRDPKCIFPFESNNPRVKEWWYVACQIQELLTNTDPTNCDFDEYKADVEAARGGNE